MLMRGPEMSFVAEYTFNVGGKLPRYITTVCS